MSPEALALLLSRIQFAFTISFHIIFPAFTVGLAAWLTPPYSITIAQAAAPESSLAFLFWGAGLFVLPLILLYNITIYAVFRGKTPPDGHHY